MGSAEYSGFAWRAVSTGVCLLVAMLWMGGAVAQGRLLFANPDNYRQLLRQLGPGDTLRLAPGEYRRGLVVHDLHGEPEAPIVIEGPADPPFAVILGRSGHNTVSIKDSRHVVIRNFEIDGQGAFVDGVKCEGHAGYAHHITLENLRIHNLAKHQQSVGISTKCPAWDWVVRGNHIDGVGTGMYFGNSDGSDPFVGGLIENNEIINTIGYNLQIKHQKARPPIDGMPTETRLTIIRRNRFVKEKGGSVDVAARPNVLVGHFPLEGPGSDDTYAIYGNLFFENPDEALFQGEGNIALYSNVFFNSHENEFPAIAIQPHNDVPRRVRIFQNSVAHPSIGIRVIRHPDRFVDDQEIVGNIVFARQPLDQTRDNKVVESSDQSTVNFFSTTINTATLKELSSLTEAKSCDEFDASSLRWLPDYDLDHLGTKRVGSSCGAFVM
jgi:hypothetical protein